MPPDEPPLLDEEISNAWLEAAADLGIRVTAPFAIVLPDGHRMMAEAYIFDFGRPNGAIAISSGNPLFDKRPSEEWDGGKFLSCLFPIYRTYDRDFFIETLHDWGWFGTSSAPSWYKGCQP